MAETVTVKVEIPVRGLLTLTVPVPGAGGAEAARAAAARDACVIRALRDPLVVAVPAVPGTRAGMLAVVADPREAPGYALAEE